MQKKPFDPDSFADRIEQEDGIIGGISTLDIDELEFRPRQERLIKPKKKCHKCGSTTYTRLRYDKDAVGFRRDSAIGCTKCVK